MRSATSKSSRRPSFGWPRGATSHAPRYCAFMATLTEPVHQPANRRRTTTWAIATSGVRDGDSRRRTSIGNSTHGDGPPAPRVRARSPPRNPSDVVPCATASDADRSSSNHGRSGGGTPGTPQSLPRRIVTGRLRSRPRTRRRHREGGDRPRDRRSDASSARAPSPPSDARGR